MGATFGATSRSLRHPNGKTRALGSREEGLILTDWSAEWARKSDADIDAVVSTVLGVLREMGIDEAGPDSVLAAPGFYAERVLLDCQSRFAEFMSRLCVKLGFVGYPFEDVALLDVRQFAAMFLDDSCPDPPAVRLSAEQYTLRSEAHATGPGGRQKAFPICFVLGAPRSGTTLLRAMLDRHPDLWAPGELHMANFSDMASRAEGLRPVLRYMPVPEIATRCSMSVSDCALMFRRWERDAVPTADVFEQLFEAAPNVMIVDKSPPYAVHRRVLEAIGSVFPQARFLHITRNPHDMVRSYVKMQLHRGNRHLFERGRNPYQVGEAIWYACNANSVSLLEQIPAERSMRIRYEDLTAAPSEAMADVCRLLGLEAVPAMADPYSASGPIARGAGDLNVHLTSRVEHRAVGPPSHELGARCLALAERFGYASASG